MRNIPDFDCEYGSAQLILQDVTRTGKLWVVVNWVTAGGLAGLLGECARFGRMVDARQVLALKESFGPEAKTTEELYPVALEILELQTSKEELGTGDCALFPLTPELGQEYLERYNAAMTGVEGAKLLEERDLPRLLREGGCYFVHKEGRLLGFGQVQGQELLALGACVPGAGAGVVRTLAELVQSDTVKVAVATGNRRALALYHRLGFVPCAIRETWVQVYKEP